jgi:nicotinate-nucleotide adenylyltransferase
MASKAAGPAASKHRLIFGGSFNPIHYGHLICARAAAEALGYEQVVLVPSAQPPHKPGAADLAPAGDRLAMAKLAIGQSTLFKINRIELEREGPSYTIDTARQLKAGGWGKIDWLIGADMVQILPQWHQPEELLREVNFVVLARPGWQLNWEKLPKRFRFLRDGVVEAPMIQISASEIRQRVREGRSIEFLTPAAVVEYIAERGLYTR